MTENDKDPYEPTHADYQALDEIVLEIATAAASVDFDVREHLVRLVDPTSAAYIGVGRAVAYLGLESAREIQERMAEVMALSMFWVEGLHVGSTFIDRKQKE